MKKKTAEDIKPNTGDHEKVISEAAKSMVAGVLDMGAVALTAAIPKVGTDDPLAAERYVHLADTLSSIAARLYEVGERSRLVAADLYTKARIR